MKHSPVIGGLVYLIRILPNRGGSVFGSLEEDGEIVFDYEFDSYKDAYWALMSMDGQEFLLRSENTVSTY